MPSSVELKELIRELNLRLSSGVNINTVVTDDLTNSDKLKKINGLYVVLKYVTKEPTSYSNWNYGYIIQRDLKITRDWQGQKLHDVY